MDMLDIAGKFRFQRTIAEAHGFAVIPVAVERLGAVLQSITHLYMQFGHQLTDIGFGIFGVEVKDPLAVFVGGFPVAILQIHERAFEQRRSAVLRGGGFPHDDRFFCCRCGIARLQHLADAANEVLNEADLGHVVGLQNGKRFGEIIGVHVPIAGEQQPVPILLHQRKEPAPFVLYPHSIEVFGSGADNHHDSG